MPIVPDPDALHISVTTEGSVHRLVLAGDLDAFGELLAVSAGTDGLALPDVRTLVIDLAAVGFVDSAGLGALVRLRNTAEAGGQQIVLANVSPQVRRLLTITGMLDLFGFQP